MCTTLPDVLITVMGIEKVVPSFRDLEVMLQLLPRSATGERMNPYTSIWTGVQPGDGPQAFHLVLLDNGRTRALADEVGRAALRCIRCSACINVCPVYRQTGGHAYFTPYAGPIGAMLQPQLDGGRGPRRRSRLPRRFAAPAPTCARCGWTSRRCSSTSGARPLRHTTISSGRASASWAGSSARAVRTSLPSDSPALSSGRWCAGAGSPLSSRPAAGLGPQPRPAGGSGCHVPRMVEVPVSAREMLLAAVSAREVVLAAVRDAVEDAVPPVVPRQYRLAGSAASDEIVATFFERIRDYKGAVVYTGDARAAVEQVLAEQAAGRVGIPRDLPARLRPTGVELIEDAALAHRELEGLDAVVTTCAAACALTGTLALDGGPGQGRRALHAPSGPPYLRRSGGADRGDRAGARAATRGRGRRRQAHRPRLGPVGDLRYRARTRRGRTRPPPAGRRRRAPLGRGLRRTPRAAQAARFEGFSRLGFARANPRLEEAQGRASGPLRGLPRLGFARANPRLRGSSPLCALRIERSGIRDCTARNCPGRLTLDEVRREGALLGRRTPTQQLVGGRPELVRRLVHRRQRRVGHGGELDVVVADDGDVCGRPRPALAQPVDDPDREQVVRSRRNRRRRPAR